MAARRLQLLLIAAAWVSWLAVDGLQTSTVQVRSGLEFAHAVATPDAIFLWIMNDIFIDDTNWEGFSLPILVERNISFQGFPGLSALPVLNIAASTGAIRLAQGIALSASEVVVTQNRRGLGSLSPGFDLLAPCPANETGAFVLLRNVLLVHPVCLPREMQVATLGNLTRPAFFPGQQAVGDLLPQAANCSNLTSAHLLQRCWPRWGRYDDLALPGRDADDAGGLRASNYYIHVLMTQYICQLVTPDGCVEALGPTGCFLYVLSNKLPSKPAAVARLPPPLPPPPHIGDVALRTRTRSPSDPAPADDSTSPPLLAILLPCALGGVAIAVAVVGWLLWRRRVGRKGSRRCCAVQATAQPAGAAWGGLVIAEGVAAGAGGSDLYDGPPSDAGLALVLSNASAEGPLLCGTKITGSSPVFTASAVCGGCEVVVHDAPVIVTPFTPHRSDLKLDVQCDTEVKLLPVVRGQGNFGRVVEGVYGGQRVAVKLVPDMSQWSGEPRNALRSYFQEVEVLGRCQHPNVVCLLAACLSPPRLCLVMELMEASLDKLIHVREPSAPLLPLDKVLHIGMEVARGLEYLHPTIVHRDLKPGNVLLNDPHGPRPVVKLTDFGLSRLRSTVQITRHPEAGTPPYMAPELYDISNNTVTDKSDIYSLGVVLWEMLAGLVPWQGCDALVVAYAITINRTRLSFASVPPERCPPKLKKLIERLWDHDPLRRPAAAEVVKQLALIQQDQARSDAATATPDSRPPEDRPAEDKPSEDRPAEDRPAEDRPAEDRPAEDRPAEDKPPEDKPPENKP